MTTMLLTVASGGSAHLVTSDPMGGAADVAADIGPGEVSYDLAADHLARGLVLVSGEADLVFEVSPDHSVEVAQRTAAGDVLSYYGLHGESVTLSLAPDVTTSVFRLA